VSRDMRDSCVDAYQRALDETLGLTGESSGR
jgi:hypothetical protein